MLKALKPLQWNSVALPSSLSVVQLLILCPPPQKKLSSLWITCDYWLTLLTPIESRLVTEVQQEPCIKCKCLTICVCILSYLTYSTLHVISLKDKAALVTGSFVGSQRVLNIGEKTLLSAVFEFAKDLLNQSKFWFDLIRCWNDMMFWAERCAVFNSSVSKTDGHVGLLLV